MITLDDIHWADCPASSCCPTSRPTLETRRLLVVAAYRDLPAERTEALDATLATVSREDVAARARPSPGSARPRSRT